MEKAPKTWNEFFKKLQNEEFCEKLLMEEQYEDLYNSIDVEINKLDEMLKSVKIEDVLTIMGFPVNNNDEDEYNNNERYLENFRSSKSFSNLDSVKSF